MSNQAFVAAFFASVVMAGCQSPDTSRAPATSPIAISDQQKEAAKQAIAGRIDEIIRGASQLNVDAAARPYSSDPGFRIVNPDGSIADFQTMKRSQEEAFKTMASMSFTTTREDFTFLSSELVICTWTGTSEFELKTGEKMKIDPYVGSMVFRKEGAEWKIIYAHETAAAPVAVDRGR